MARTLAFVPNVSGSALLPLADIPEDVMQEIDDAYENLRGHDGRIRATFDSKEEADIYCKQAASYAAQRPAGALKFRRSPTKGLAENVVDFTVKADLPANAAAGGTAT
jgi:hypothetical protein